MRSVISLAAKDLRLLMRDKFGLFWVLAFPLMMALFFGSIFGGGGSGTAGSLKVAMIVDEPNPTAQAFYDELSKASVIAAVTLPYDSARHLVARGKLTAYVHYQDTSSQGLAFFGGSKPSIEVGMDPSRKAEAGFMHGLVNQAYFIVLQKKMMDPAQMHQSLNQQMEAVDAVSNLTGDQKSFLIGMMSNLDEFMQTMNTSPDTSSDSVATSAGSSEDYSPFGQPDINYVDVAAEREGPRSAFEITFPQALQWALIGVAAAFALSIVTERTRGTLLRLRLAPITRAHILAGKGLACFTACVSVCALLMAIGILIFGVRVVSWGGLIAAFGASSFCFVGLMMMVSVMGKTEQAVGGAGWAMFLVFSMTGGGMVPLVMLPGWMHTIGSISPVKWSILAMEGAIWRGMSPSEMMLPIGVLLGMGLLGFVIGVTILSRSD